VTRYLASFFWKRDYNTIPSSPTKSAENSFDLGSTSASPSNVIDFEKDAEEINFTAEEEDEIPHIESEFCTDPLRVVDKEFDAEVVDVGIISSEEQRPRFETPVNDQEELPVVLGEGKILSMRQIVKLAKYLPIVLQQHYWVLLYSVLRDGADFSTFFHRTRG
jgi:hypothetical protein